MTFAQRRRAWLAGLLFGLAGAVAQGQDVSAVTFATPRRLGVLANQQISESSGLAISWRRPGVLWTHNDSGDGMRVFALDSTGKDLGECRIRNSAPLDCEDIASFQWLGKCWLLLADTGDNGRLRTSYALHLFEEPAVAGGELTGRSIEFRYEDGPHDCEAVAVDTSQNVVLLATKRLAPETRLYQIPLAQLIVSGAKNVARHVATVPVPMATALDISPDGRLAVFATYLDGFLFSRGDGETWKAAFQRAPRRIPLPLRSQGESVCFGRDGRSLYLTSEKLPAPLWEIPAELPQSK
jgi:hypothetical protein